HSGRAVGGVRGPGGAARCRARRDDAATGAAASREAPEGLGDRLGSRAVFERTMTEHGLVAPWLFISGALLILWDWAQRVAPDRWRNNPSWTGIWLVGGLVIHLAFFAGLGAFAFAPRHSPWFDPRPLPNAR